VLRNLKVLHSGLALPGLRLKRLARDKLMTKKFLYYGQKSFITFAPGACTINLFTVCIVISLLVTVNYFSNACEQGFSQLNLTSKYLRYWNF
jgi:hypothetical protein